MFSKDKDQSLFPSINSTRANFDRSYYFCEFCGLRYSNIKNKNIHQIYYCMGRDLSLEKSLAKLRNNLSLKKFNSNSSAYLFSNSKNTLKETEDDRPSSTKFQSDSTYKLKLKPLSEDNKYVRFC